VPISPCSDDADGDDDDAGRARVAAATTTAADGRLGVGDADTGLRRRRATFRIRRADRVRAGVTGRVG
jgi:hypothetical protein